MVRSLLASALLIAACLACGEAGAAGVGRVVKLSGSVVAVKADGRKLALAVGSEVDAGDTLHTYVDSQAALRFDDGGSVMLRPESEFRIDDFAFRQEAPADDKLIFALLKGGLRTLTGLIGKRNRSDAYRMQAPTATIGIRGTDYGLTYCPAGECADRKNTAGEPLADGLHIEVLGGRIFVTNAGGSVDIAAGQFGYVKDGDTAPVVGATGYLAPGLGPAECAVK